MPQKYYKGKNNDFGEAGRQLTDEEILTAFPEARGIIEEKIKEWEENMTEIRKVIKEKLRIIKTSNADEFSKWFCKEFLRLQYGKDLLEIKGHIRRLKQLLRRIKNQGQKPPLITLESKQRALSVPIASVVNVQLRKRGSKLVGLCPLHSETHPSFFVYPESNRFKCYGCNQGGDVIDFVKLAHGYSFKKAVTYLCQNKKKGETTHESKLRGGGILRAGERN